MLPQDIVKKILELFFICRCTLLEPNSQYVQLIICIRWIHFNIMSYFGWTFQYLMDKGEEMINHEYDQLVDKDHFDHCHQCKHRRQSVSFSEQYVHLQFRHSILLLLQRQIPNFIQTISILNWRPRLIPRTKQWIQGFQPILYRKHQSVQYHWYLLQPSRHSFLYR